MNLEEALDLFSLTIQYLNETIDDPDQVQEKIKWLRLRLVSLQDTPFRIRTKPLHPHTYSIQSGYKIQEITLYPFKVSFFIRGEFERHRCIDIQYPKTRYLHPPILIERQKTASGEEIAAEFEMYFKNQRDEKP